MTTSLQECVRRISVASVRLEQALEQVGHMDFSPDERKRFGPHMRHWHSETWFPTGLHSVSAVVAHELEPFQSGISRSMLDDAARCCSHCERFTISGGRLRSLHGKKGKMEATASLIQRLHASRPLPDLTVYASDHDVYQPPSGLRTVCERAGGIKGLRPPIIVHAKRETDRGLLAGVESTFFQSYGRNDASWDIARAKLVAAGRAAEWSRRAERIYFRGSGSGYRKFLNYTNSGQTPLAGTDIWHSSPPYCDGSGQIIRAHEAADGRRPLSPRPSSPRHRCTPFVNMSSHCGNKHLLHLAGTWPGHSNRLKWLMACGSVVVMPQNDWYEWWQLLLAPFETFVPTASIALANGRDLPAVQRCLVQHGAEAQRIADAARRFTEEALSELQQARYMRALLTGYATLQRKGHTVLVGG